MARKPVDRSARDRLTLARYADKGYGTSDFVATCRTLTVTPHVARNLARAGGSALDARTVRHPAYDISQWIRKRVEEAFGWMKTVGGLRRHPLSWLRTGADACLPGGRRLQPDPNRQALHGSRMKQRSSHLLHPVQWIKAAAG